MSNKKFLVRKKSNDKEKWIGNTKLTKRSVSKKGFLTKLELEELISDKGVGKEEKKILETLPTFVKAMAPGSVHPFYGDVTRRDDWIDPYLDETEVKELQVKFESPKINIERMVQKLKTTKVQDESTKSMRIFEEQSEEQELQRKFLVAAEVGSLSVVRRILHKWNDEGSVVSLVNKGLETNEITPLMYAASRGHYEIAVELLEVGAKVDMKDKEGETALLKAAYGGYARLVKLLIRYGADCRIADKDGWTALHNAAGRGHLEIVKVLTDEDDVIISAQSKQGHTPLMNAASTGRVNIVEHLLSTGKAGIALKNRFGENAYDVAAVGMHADVCRLLEEAEKLEWIKRQATGKYTNIMVHASVEGYIFNNSVELIFWCSFKSFKNKKFKYNIGDLNDRTWDFFSNHVSHLVMIYENERSWGTERKTKTETGAFVGEQQSPISNTFYFPFSYLLRNNGEGGKGFREKSREMEVPNRFSPYYLKKNLDPSRWCDSNFMTVVPEEMGLPQQVTTDGGMGNWFWLTDWTLLVNVEGGQHQYSGNTTYTDEEGWMYSKSGFNSVNGIWHSTPEETAEEIGAPSNHVRRRRWVRVMKRQINFADYHQSNPNINDGSAHDDGNDGNDGNGGDDDCEEKKLKKLIALEAELALIIGKDDNGNGDAVEIDERKKAGKKVADILEMAESILESNGKKVNEELEQIVIRMRNMSTCMIHDNTDFSTSDEYEKGADEDLNTDKRKTRTVKKVQQAMILSDGMREEDEIENLSEGQGQGQGRGGNDENSGDSENEDIITENAVGNDPQEVESIHRNTLPSSDHQVVQNNDGVPTSSQTKVDASEERDNTDILMKNGVEGMEILQEDGTDGANVVSEVELLGHTQEELRNLLRQFSQAVASRQYLPEQAWLPDVHAPSCCLCGRKFKLFFRRHHCRRCGLVFCDNCSRERLWLSSRIHSLDESNEDLPVVGYNSLAVLAYINIMSKLLIKYSRDEVGMAMDGCGNNSTTTLDERVRYVLNSGDQVDSERLLQLVMRAAETNEPRGIYLLQPHRVCLTCAEVLSPEAYQMPPGLLAIIDLISIYSSENTEAQEGALRVSSCASTLLGRKGEDQIYGGVFPVDGVAIEVPLVHSEDASLMLVSNTLPATFKYVLAERQWTTEALARLAVYTNAVFANKSLAPLIQLNGTSGTSYISDHLEQIETLYPFALENSGIRSLTVLLLSLLAFGVDSILNFLPYLPPASLSHRHILSTLTVGSTECPVCFKSWISIWSFLTSRIPGEGFIEAQERHVRDCLSSMETQICTGRPSTYTQINSEENLNIQPTLQPTSLLGRSLNFFSSGFAQNGNCTNPNSNTNTDTNTTPIARGSSRNQSSASGGTRHAGQYSSPVRGSGTILDTRLQTSGGRPISINLPSTSAQDGTQVNTESDITLGSGTSQSQTGGTSSFRLPENANIVINSESSSSDAKARTSSSLPSPATIAPGSATFNSSTGSDGTNTYSISSNSASIVRSAAGSGNSNIDNRLSQNTPFSITTYSNNNSNMNIGNGSNLQKPNFMLNSTRYITYTLNEDTPMLGTECSICFEDFESGNAVTRLGCFCTFHEHCIKSWFKRNPACPLHF
ncbi:Ankyrin repeat and KH domain-containing protein 1 [Zancudomyces culisetae]|uniref:Ankyrin repeat and KH domain-containing protein 1 n=1 Tax=Zancudomyces culisetae TaxID=1213189 RepID=A0A1R1PZA3_ZANCU|nr:Ankyrin repeat and KH domain-containing protein 1 [Zancudomyces culisetae]|eukprot:OMH86276.1 Ankyrin repeat and KH domain-containing protein 1 [Zancudomyces culisetae]